MLNVMEILAKNKSFKNTHLGERCFILGNGPSLKKVDLSLLTDEFVFTVNNFSLLEGYEKVKTNVHLWADLAFFNLNENLPLDMDMVMENYRKISSQNPICFVDIEAYKFAHDYKLDKILNLHYFAKHGTILDNQIQIEIDRPITSYWNVVQYAIVIAIYMGFKEIYLLGCDSTMILGNINAVLNKPISDIHVYDDKGTDDINFKTVSSKYKISHILFNYYCTFIGYEKLFYLCNNILNVKLVNCSSITLIDSIPRMPLNAVLQPYASEIGGGGMNLAA